MVKNIKNKILLANTNSNGYYSQNQNNESSSSDNQNYSNNYNNHQNPNESTAPSGGSGSAPTSIPPDVGLQTTNPVVEMDLDPNKIRFSQDFVNFRSGGNSGQTIYNLLDSVKATGFDPRYPIDVVQMSDGRYTSFDNRRLLVARIWGVQVRVRVHSHNERLPDDWNRQEGILGERTWGNAVLARVRRQTSTTFSFSRPLGSFDLPYVRISPEDARENPGEGPAQHVPGLFANTELEPELVEIINQALVYCPGYDMIVFQSDPEELANTLNKHIKEEKDKRKRGKK